MPTLEERIAEIEAAIGMTAGRSVYHGTDLHVPRNNFSTLAVPLTVAPTTTDDSSKGYGPGSLWTTAANSYYCTSAAVGAAVWTAITGAGAAPESYTTADLALTTTIADCGTATITIVTAGKYLIVGTFDFEGTVTGWGTAQGWLYLNGAAVQPGGQQSFAQQTDSGSATGGGNVASSWVLTLAANDVLKLRALKTVNAGTVNCKAQNTRITAITIAGAGGGGGGGASLGTPALTLGTTNALGAATTALGSDATILAFDATAPAAVGAAAAGAAAVTARRDHVHPTGAGTPSTQAFGDAAAIGTGPAAAMTDHKHAMMAAPKRQLVIGADSLAVHATNTLGMTPWLGSAATIKFTIVYEGPVTNGMVETWVVKRRTLTNVVTTLTLANLTGTGDTTSAGTQAADATSVTVTTGDVFYILHTAGDTSGTRCRIVGLEV